MRLPDVIEVGGTVAAALAAIAAWRASASSREAMIRSAAEQREEGRARRLAWIEDAHGALSELLVITMRGQQGNARWNELMLKLRRVLRVLNSLGYKTDATFEVI